ncbi:hypothetical protein PROFUN_00370 [Planoprotostelium fungivorum]|uniref:GPI transamidase component PIG-S n=1 Tax=Planoprotostelium fungivorum TaxID=1890364 RepID=A0A2P6NY96_9EUKA|nr:hypothetical protein PROFUN_00370 [Planoprotostelium fungivorum]
MVALDDRQKVIVSFVISIALGIPVWWYSMQVYRAPLPHDIMTNTHVPDDWRLKLSVHVVGNQANVDNALEVFKQHVDAFETPERYTQPRTKTQVEFNGIYDSNLIVPEKEIDDWLLSRYNATNQSVNGVYALYILLTDRSSDKTLSLGKYRHGWVCTSPQNIGADFVRSMAQSSQNYMLNRPSDNQIAMRPAVEYKISFSMLNMNPQLLRPDWDIEGAVRSYLRPFLNEIHDVADFKIDSQIIHYTSLLKQPSFDRETKRLFIDHDKLSMYLNPSTWNLDLMEMSIDPVIHLILFVTEPGQPIYIREEGGKWSETNAFISPQWGGVFIYNPPTSGDVLLSSVVDLQPAMEIFVSQLRQLLGVGEISSDEVVYHHQMTKGISQYERDLLYRRYTWLHYNQTVSTIKSLSVLVQSLQNMVVHDNIASLVDHSLQELELCREKCRDLDYDSAVLHARTATRDAEIAFFDPDMLALLYFPQEHKAAIYALPFFPVFFQLISGIISEIRHRRKQKEE